MLTLAGRELLFPTRALLDHIARYIHPRDVNPFLARSWPGTNLVGVAAPTGLYRPRDLEFNRLFWPAGASRWAYGHFLASAEQVSDIRAAAHGDDGDSDTGVDLVMDSPPPGESSGDPSGPERLTTSVHLLRITPLSQLPGTAEVPSNNLYCLTVVDDRWYWQFAPCPDFGITLESPKSWDDCIGMMGTALGVDIGVDPVPAEYLVPDVSLNLPGESSAMVLDALAWNVGMRVVRGFDGSVRLQSFATADARRRADDASRADRAFVAGGDLFRATL